MRSRAKPRWGYRRAHARLVEEGWSINRKRTQRLWRSEGLRVPARKRKRRRLGDNSEAKRLRADRPNHVWALDFQSDETADGRALRLLNVVDEFTREALATDCERSITADATVAVLERLVAARGTAPERIRCDNGIEPGSPWQNPYVESFNARVRDEVLDVELLATLPEAKLILDDWRSAYNTSHPHSALAMLPPARSSALRARLRLAAPCAGHPQTLRPYRPP